MEELHPISEDKAERIRTELKTILDAFREAHGLDAIVCTCSLFDPADESTHTMSYSYGNHYLRECLARRYADQMEDARRMPPDLEEF